MSIASLTQKIEFLIYLQILYDSHFFSMSEMSTNIHPATQVKVCGFIIDFSCSYQQSENKPCHPSHLRFNEVTTSLLTLSDAESLTMLYMQQMLSFNLCDKESEAFKSSDRPDHCCFTSFSSFLSHFNSTLFVFGLFSSK